MRNKRGVLLVVSVLLMACLIGGCASTFPRKNAILVDNANEIWQQATSKSIVDKAKFIDLDVKIALKDDKTVSCVIGGELVMERFITPEKLTVKVVLNKLSMKADKYVAALINIDNIGLIDVTIYGEMMVGKARIVSTVQNLGKVFQGAPNYIETVLLEDDKFDYLDNSIIRNALMLSLYGNIGVNGVIDAANKEYKYSLLGSDKINTEFLKIVKILVDINKNLLINNEMTLHDFLYNYYGTRDIIGIANKYIKQNQVNITGKLAPYTKGYYFSNISTVMDSKIELDKDALMPIFSLIKTDSINFDNIKSLTIDMELLMESEYKIF